MDFVGNTIANSFDSNGYNLIGDGNATGAFNQTGDQIDPEPGLDRLGSYGGPTQTHRLQPESPAIDKGSSGATTDQRGQSRPHDFTDIANATGGDGSDIGAFELQSGSAFSINDITVTEGNSATTAATFTVSLIEASSQTVTVNYATADGTATAGTDYQSSSGTLTFAPGQTTQTVSVQVNGENVSEEDESFFVNLSNPTNATISDAQGQGTITNDDDPPPDTQAPKVISTFPRDGGEVGPAANIRATFSEHDLGEEGMMPSSITGQTFKLFRKGSTNQIAATVTYDAATDTATLNPTDNLRRGVTYKAVVTTLAKDVAGNRLDQNDSRGGLQRMVWFFEIDN